MVVGFLTNTVYQKKIFNRPNRNAVEGNSNEQTRQIMHAINIHINCGRQSCEIPGRGESKLISYSLSFFFFIR